MIQECKFNPLSDIEETVPELAADVGEIMSTHVVVDTGDNAPFTKETDIHQVGHYLRDKIQTAIAAMELSKSMSAVSKSNTPTTQGNSSSAAPTAPSTPSGE